MTTKKETHSCVAQFCFIAIHQIIDKLVIGNSYKKGHSILLPYIENLALRGSSN